MGMWVGIEKHILVQPPNKGSYSLIKEKSVDFFLFFIWLGKCSIFDVPLLSCQGAVVLGRHNFLNQKKCP